MVPPVKRQLQKMDFEAAQKVDYFVSISKEVQSRVKKHYNRDSTVVYPPVDTERFQGRSERGNFFLVVSRLGGYKKVDIVVQAFNQLGLPLKIVGQGPQFDYLKSISKNNIEFLGRLSDAETTGLLLRCKALIFPTHEDFGIVPVEAMAAGKPVIAFRGGGAIETLVDGVTGKFFEKQTPDAIIEIVKNFDPASFRPDDCRAQAQVFSKQEFQKKMKGFVTKVWEKHTTT
jgi:glycosyltransferase involved in cell wall biosynthesis